MRRFPVRPSMLLRVRFLPEMLIKLVTDCAMKFAFRFQTGLAKDFLSTLRVPPVAGAKVDLIAPAWGRSRLRFRRRVLCKSCFYCIMIAGRLVGFDFLFKIALSLGTKLSNNLLEICTE